MIFPFEAMNPLRKRKSQKILSLHKRILEKLKIFENLGATFKGVGNPSCFSLCKAPLLFLYFFEKFFGPLAVARRVLWIRGCLSFHPSVLSSFHPSVLSGCFLGIGPLVFFLKLSVVLGAHMPLCVTARFKKKIFFAQKIGKMGKKIGFFKLSENLVINFSEFGV